METAFGLLHEEGNVEKISDLRGDVITNEGDLILLANNDLC